LGSRTDVLVLLLLLLHPCSTKGAAKSLGNTWSAGKAAWVSALIAAGTAFLTGLIVVPLLRIKSRKHIEAVEARAAEEAEEKRWVLKNHHMSNILLVGLRMG
jgi:hypothetical protein